MTIYRLSRRTFLIGATATAVTSLPLIKGCVQVDDSNPIQSFDDLAQVGESFTLALIADPQLHQIETENVIGITTQRKYSEMIAEINAIRPPVAFTLINGDLVEQGIPAHIENFITRSKELDSMPILVHGNHDGSYPYPELARMQRELNGTEAAQFSFDCGRWHFVTFPCNLGGRDRELELLTRLRQDLEAHRSQPTIIFEHLHLLPQGLTPLEWYTYNKQFRKELVDLITHYPNIRYVICGHVHNGIKASVKTAWTYKGIHFITAPTCTAVRNFGDEYPEFAAGIQQDNQDSGGGYYLLIDVNGDDVRIRGRLVGVEDEFVYPTSFKEYQDDDPLWFKQITEFPVHPALINPSFEEDLTAWMRPYRYQAEPEPSYITKTVTQPTRGSGKALYLFSRESGQAWANEEMVDVYQMVQVPQGASPCLRVNYYPEAQLDAGGGYIYMIPYQGDRPTLVLLLDWGNDDKERNKHMSQHLLYTATGDAGRSFSLACMGQQQQALFWTLPSTPHQWHVVEVRLGDLYDQAVQTPGAFAALGVDKVLVGLGVWSFRKRGARSGAFFDELDLSFGTPGAALLIDHQPVPIDQRIFETTFAKRDLQKRNNRQC